MDYPDYWPKTGWSGEDDPIGAWMEEYGLNKYSTAELPEGEMYRAVELFIARNLAKKKVSMSVKSGTYQGIARWKKETIVKDMRNNAQGISRDRARALQNVNAILDKKGNAGRNVASSAVIRKIMVVRNDAVWKRYCGAREQMLATIQDHEDPLPFKKVRWIDAAPTPIGKSNASLPVIDQSIGEMYLFHGTDVIDKISADGFITDVRKFGKKAKESHGRVDWGMLGMGSYFADAMGKSMVYFLCGKHGKYDCECTRQVMLCRVIVGRALVRRTKTNPYGRMKNWLRSDTADEVRGEKMAASIGDAKYHSVIASSGFKAGGFSENEFLIKRSEMVYPEFVIHYGIQ